MRFATRILLLFFVVGVSFCAVLKAEASEIQISKEYLKHFKPITMKVVDNPNNPVTPAKVSLGKMLYHDPRLSKSGLFSCNTCHNIASYGMSNLPTDIGHKWAIGPVNSGTVLNAVFYEAQFWDGRAKDLEEQAKGPILAPVEMAMPSEQAAVDRIKSIPGYKKMFASAFPKEKDPITYDNIAKAIAAFERTLITPSRFDKFLLGDKKALSNEEKRGLKTFVDTGCVSCHNGIALGGGFKKMGVVKPYNSKSPSKGRYDVTKKNEDMNVFKMTTLRNIEMTYPYFHDGQVWSLEEAIKIMADIQLGKALKEEEVRAITAFLKSLTGEIPKEALQMPVLPPSGKDTPKPSYD
ncbi:MAG: cytochrome-c peroxidase [Thermodesulfovibrionales bacterium]|nr:cytochrome-c peroxidase [Thermodesulfovibrionales bacterium]